jgi:pimeloyl-ACP methyl ester carboxylesterase
MKKIVFLTLFIGLGISHSWGQSQFVVNGDFSTNNYAWTQSGNLYYNSVISYAHLVDANYVPANNLYGYISQQYYIPANTNNIRCKFDRHITSSETSLFDKYDSLYISLSDGSNTYYWSLSNLDADSNWKSFNGSFFYNLNNYLINLLGKNVTFKILGVTDVSLPTLFQIDNVELWVDPVPNDECSDAIELSSDYECFLTRYSTLGASESMLGCAGNADDDVWFKFVAVDSVHTIIVKSEEGFDAVVDIRTGSCPGSTVTNGCVDLTGSGGIETANLIELTPGNTYYFRVFNYGMGCGGADFELCITSPQPQYCSSTTLLNNCTGSIDDGSGLNNYSNNAHCSWLIQPPGATSITLAFTQFDIESKYDSVTVYNGATISSNVLGTFSGSDLPTAISSTGGSMLVVFNSDNSVTKSGWFAFYSCTSGSVINQYSVFNHLQYHVGASPNTIILANGNTLQPAPVIKICADGSDATQIQFTNNTGINSQNIKFWIGSDPYGNEPDLKGYFINYKISGNTITADYAHPKYIPASAGLFRNEIIRIVDYTNPDNTLFIIPIRIFRAPVLFVHGWNGDIDTFKEMQDSFIDDLYYTRGLCHRVNYALNSWFGFAVNKFVIPIGINSLLNTCREDSISAAKVDIIAHSMGGIISRLYLQGNYEVPYRNDINRIITLNTPHSGSQLANFVLGDLTGLSCLMLGYLDNSYWTDCPNVFADLSVNSIAIDNELNGQLLNSNIVPCSTISTEEDTQTTGWQCIALNTLLNYHFLNYLPITINSIFNSEVNDLVVANSSQNAGLSLNSNFHMTNQCHLGSTRNSSIIAWCETSLSQDPKSAYFSQDGFHPVNLSYPKNMDNSGISLVVTGNVTITNPPNGTIAFPGDVISINITGSSNIAKLTIAVGNKSIPLYSDFRMSNSNEFFYTVPSEAYGEIRIIAVGIDNESNFVDLDTLRINVNTNALLDSLSIYPKIIAVSENFNYFFNLKGYFSDGIERDLTYTPTIQTLITNNSTASYSSPCSIKGLKAGSTELKITYMSKTIQVPISVYQGEGAFSIPDPESNNTINYSSLKIFPNPSTGNFKIEYNTKVGEVLTTNIYNELGQKIYSMIEKATSELFMKEIRLNSISAGVYHVTITSEKKSSSGHFVVVSSKD